MPVTYEKAGTDVRTVVSDLIEEHHPDLAEAEVRVGVLIAYNRDDDGKLLPGSAVKWARHDVAAKVRVVSLRDRVHGMPDAEIILDGNSWSDRREIQQRAILDHELEHLVVKREGNKPNAPFETDDSGRPKIKACNADWLLEGFKVIAQRYGEDALEVECFRHAVDAFGQFLLYEPAMA